MADILLIKTAKKLSKAQEAFNKLIKRIEKRKKEIDKLATALKKYFVKRRELGAKVFEERMEWQVKYVRLLDEAYPNKLFSKKDREKIAQMILNISAPYDENETQHPDLLIIAQKYNQKQFDKLSERDKEMSKEMMQEYMNDMFGVDIDLSEEDFNFENLRKKLEEKFNDQSAAEAEENKNADAFRRKNKHVGGNTARSKAIAEQLNKSWKKIYLKLVKILHPDAELDEALKIEKDAVLKEVTTAYESNNFYKLLQLHIEHGDLDGLPEYFENEDVLKQYSNILKQQDIELRDELDGLLGELYGHKLFFLEHRADDANINLHITAEIKELEKIIKKMKKEVTLFSDVNNLKKELKEIDIEDLLPGDDFFGMEL